MYIVSVLSSHALSAAWLLLQLLRTLQLLGQTRITINGKIVSSGEAWRSYERPSERKINVIDERLTSCANRFAMLRELEKETEKQTGLSHILESSCQEMENCSNCKSK